MGVQRAGRGTQVNSLRVVEIKANTKDVSQSKSKNEALREQVNGDVDVYGTVDFDDEAPPADLCD